MPADKPPPQIKIATSLSKTDAWCVSGLQVHRTTNDYLIDAFSSRSRVTDVVACRICGAAESQVSWFRSGDEIRSRNDLSTGGRPSGQMVQGMSQPQALRLAHQRSARETPLIKSTLGACPVLRYIWGPFQGWLYPRALPPATGIPPHSMLTLNFPSNVPMGNFKPVVRNTRPPLQDRRFARRDYLPYTIFTTWISGLGRI